MSICPQHKSKGQKNVLQSIGRTSRKVPEDYDSRAGYCARSSHVRLVKVGRDPPFVCEGHACTLRTLVSRLSTTMWSVVLLIALLPGEASEHRYSVSNIILMHMGKNAKQQG